MLYASTRLKETSDVRVFVDSTGRRRRIVAIAGVVVAFFAALYMGVVAISLLQAPSSGLITKATVSAAPKSPATTTTPNG